MQNIQIRLQRSRLKAFTLFESLVVLSLVSFLTLSLSGSVQEIFRQTEETIFFMSFERLYKDSQQLAIASHQKVSLQIREDRISNAYQTLSMPDSVRAAKPIRIEFAEHGGNSSLAAVRFDTEEYQVQYQLYLGSGRYKKTIR